LRLTREQVEVMHRHAEAAYPDECCGLILGRLVPGTAAAAGKK
jgi:proteasome lid subunit RPN8/RPN11